MPPSLQQYINAHCLPTPAGRVRFKELADHFRSQLPASEREQWTRSRLVAELARAGFVLGNDSSNVLWVGGLIIANHAGWTEVDGRLESAANG